MNDALDESELQGANPLNFGDDPEAVAAYHDTLATLRLRSAAKRGRAEAGLSQRTVAERMGTTQSAVSDLESGRVDAQLSTWQRYARALGRRLALSFERNNVKGASEKTTLAVEGVHIPIANLTLSPLLTELSRWRGTQGVMQISEDTKLPLPLVSRVLDELTVAGWAHSIGEGNTAGFALRDDAASVVGIALHRDRVVGILTDISGTRHSKPRMLHPDDSTPESIIEACTRMTSELFLQSHDRGRPVVAIGACLAGIVKSRGEVTFAPDLQTSEHGWNGVDLEARLQDRIQHEVHTALRVGVENDANALAAWHYSALRASAPRMRESPEGDGASAAVVLMSGGGIGGGFIVDGRVIRGAHSAVGELGHLVVDHSDDAPECRAGLKHRGCLETVASVQGILRRLSIPSETAFQREQGLRRIEAMTQEGNLEAQEVLRSAGKYFGRLIPMIAVLDPNEIAVYASPYLHDTRFRSARIFQEAVIVEQDEAQRRGVMLSPAPRVAWRSLRKSTLPLAAATCVVNTHFLSNPVRWYPKLKETVERNSELILA